MFAFVWKCTTKDTYGLKGTCQWFSEGIFCSKKSRKMPSYMNCYVQTKRGWCVKPDKGWLKAQYAWCFVVDMFGPWSVFWKCGVVDKKTRPHSGPKERQPNARSNFFYPRSTKVILLHLAQRTLASKQQTSNKQSNKQTWSNKQWTMASTWYRDSDTQPQV